MFSKPIETIIVGIDFSSYSKIVVRQATHLARLWKAQIILVYAVQDQVVYRSSITGPFPNRINPIYYKNNIKKHYPIKLFSVEIVVGFGSPTDLIKKTAKKYTAPLIMAGFRGHSAMANFFLGSTAQNLALHASCPVWIHRGSKIIQPKKILIPHDLSHDSNRSIDIAKQLNLVSPVSYEVFFVREKPFPVLDYELYKRSKLKQVKILKNKIKHLLGQYPNLPFVSVSGEISEKVVQRSKGFDLIVMTHHQPQGFFTPSHTKILMNKVSTPILIL